MKAFVATKEIKVEDVAVGDIIRHYWWYQVLKVAHHPDKVELTLELRGGSHKVRSLLLKKGTRIKKMVSV